MMSRLKPLVLFLACGIAYPVTLFGWAREALLETALGPLHVLWAFALGMGGLAGLVARPGRRATVFLGGLLAMGYGVSGALWVVGPPGTASGPILLVIAWGLAVLGAVWTISLRGSTPGLSVAKLPRVRP